MPTPSLLSDSLFDPITTEQPAGVDLRWTPEWDRIREARRADDNLDSGKWTKKERKVSDWPLVKELITTVLRERSKDLQLAVWLMEANVKQHGFPGLRDSLRLTRELMLRYWDQGLYPRIEDGPEDRAGPFEWLNNKLVDSIETIPITARPEQDGNYSFLDLRDARDVGSEASCRNADGEIDSKKKSKYDAAVANGRLSMEMFERAVTETRRSAYEELNLDFQQCYAEFKELDKVIDDKFGEVAPTTSAFRALLRNIDEAISGFLEKKRLQEPDLPDALAGPAGDPGALAERPDQVVMRFPLSLPNLPDSSAGGGSWQEAEALIRSGQVGQGLAAMTRLAASETSGRNRFQRRLMLAEVCLATRREPLARLILEELAEQIDKFQLESWESSELISSVWTRLYGLYRQSADSSDSERAVKLYERLCRLDPWQALACER
jgi:type VI secretion system protein ImpA